MGNLSFHTWAPDSAVRHIMLLHHSHVDSICIGAGHTSWCNVCTTEGSHCNLLASFVYTAIHCMSPECARRLDILSRGLCLPLSAHWIIPSEPELQYITCDRWQLGRQGACQEICQACVCPEGHTRGDCATLSHQRGHTWSENYAARLYAMPPSSDRTGI